MYWPFVVNVCLMLSMPLVLAVWLERRRQPGWGLFGAGALTFILSQVLHIPFNWLVQQRFQLLPTDLQVTGNLLLVSLFLGLSAGLFEEIGRYLTYRYWVTDARTWGKGLMLGVGHGGIEAILLGVLAGANYVAMALLKQGKLLDRIPTEQLPLVQQQIEQVFSLPWYNILLGALERAFAICLHLALSLLVMQLFVRGQKRWLWAAVAWHALLDAVAVFMSVRWNAYVTELAIGILALLSVGIIFWLRTPEPVEPELEPLPPAISPLSLREIDVTAESLEKSRYS
ncbi:MAG: YhfC family glutamic-type intramembrane protease [Chloroflexota bacterium]